MNSVLITWELGGGLGHLVPIASLAKELLLRGFRVSLAAKDIATAGKLLNDVDIRLFQAPHRLEPFHSDFPLPVSYAQLLHNIGFGYAEELTALVKAWQDIYHAVNPDTILFEHSPTAMLAARSCSIRKAVFGTGFTVPPNPLPMLRDIASWDVVAVEKDAERTLETVNTTVSRLGLPRIDSLSDVYQSADKSYLGTYAELDHFERRNDVRYVGVSQMGHGPVPCWPKVGGPKVFAYLKGFGQGRKAVQQLSGLPASLIIYSPTLDTFSAQRLSELSTNAVFSAEPVNVDAIAPECDVGVCHGGHSLVAKLLLAGVPVVSIPLHQEQVILSRRLSDQFLGETVPSDRMHLLGQTVASVSQLHQFKENATSFSQRYANRIGFDLNEAIIDWLLT